MEIPIKTLSGEEVTLVIKEGLTLKELAEGMKPWFDHLKRHNGMLTGNIDVEACKKILKEMEVKKC